MDRQPEGVPWRSLAGVDDANDLAAATPFCQEAGTFWASVNGEEPHVASKAAFHFIYTELTEGFFTYFRVSLYVTLYLLVFLTAYQA